MAFFQLYNARVVKNAFLSQHAGETNFFIIFLGKNTIFSSLKIVSRLNIGATASNKGSYYTVFSAYHPSFYRFELSPIVSAEIVFKPDLGQNCDFRPFEGPETLISGQKNFYIFFCFPSTKRHPKNL